MDEQREFATGTNPATPPEHTARLDAMERRANEAPDALARECRAAFDGDDIIQMRLALRKAHDALLASPPREDKGRADIAAEVPEGDGGEVEQLRKQVQRYRSGQMADAMTARAVVLEERLEAAEQALAASRAEVERVREIIDLWFAPWGAAKAAKWEELTGDRPFDPHVALTVIRAALAAHAGSKGGE